VKLTFVLFMICLAMNSFAQAKNDLSPIPSRFRLTPEIMREANADQEAEDIRKLRHLNGFEFSEVVRSHGGDGKGGIYLSLNINNKELITIAAATSLGLVIFENDAEIMDFVQEHKQEVPQSVEDFGNFVGSRTGSMGIIAGSYFLGVVLKNKKLQKVGIISVAAGVATALVTEAFKETYGRNRPIQGEGPYVFYGEEKSFFSGHTSAAFSIATVFSEVYGKEYPVVPYIAYGVATITAYSRMRAQAHWATDVLTGAVAGILITKVIYHYTNKYFADSSGNETLSFYPNYDPKKKLYSFTMSYTPRPRRR
jgi:hypothetical protein